MASTSTGHPFVSVIIPVYNDKDGALYCLKNMADQLYPKDRLEVILVDNGSTPPISIESTYAFTVHTVRCATPGSYAARNAGVRQAVGDVFAFIDADCWPEKAWLGNGVATLLANEGKSVIGGEVLLVAPAKPSAVALYQCAGGFGQESNILDKHFSATANLFCTRAQFGAAGPFDERLLSGGDREWSWRAVKSGFAIQFEPKAVVCTKPRSSLIGALRQTRRVVAGRRMLQRLGLAHLGAAGVAKQRSTWQSLVWIFSNPTLSRRDQLRVFGVATLIRCVATVEGCRLALGAHAERR